VELPMTWIEPVILEGRWVRLEPLEWRHEPALIALRPDEEVYRYFSASLGTPQAIHNWMEDALCVMALGTELPFAIVESVAGAVIGSTRCYDIRPSDRAVEIGNTWLGRPWWRTAINSECKYLLLRHLFDVVRCQRVALRTDSLNLRSQRAIERLGAVREGVLRKHMIVHGGRARDTVYYSILDDDWPFIRRRMEARLYCSPVSDETTPSQ